MYVYSTSMSSDDAVACAYRLGSSDKLEDVAQLCFLGLQQLMNLEAMSSDKYNPPELKFLAILITGDTDAEKREKSKHFLDSIAQVSSNRLLHPCCI